MAASTTPTFEPLESRITESCPADSKQILEAAWKHDVAALKKLLDVPGKASCQDPVTGETPLHAAIRSSLAPDADLEAAKASVYELFLAGAIWNDVDDRNETPGCLALRLGKKELYNLCVEAGVRAELLFGLMEGYEALDSGAEDEDMEDEEEADEQAEEAQNGNGDAAPVEEEGDEAPELVNTSFVPPPKKDPKADVNSEDYLNSHLSYSEGKLVDDDGNGVMMAWETDIMRRSVDALIPELVPGKRVLNIGFGMGIVDTMFAATSPARHHIIEAHPDVLARVATPGSKFGQEWEKSGSEEGAFKIHGGKWQEICPKLLEAGEVYDAIYFDTFGEDYSQLRLFFDEYVPGLLDQNGIFGFFNGLGADRRVVYDVYTKVVEIHLTDAGLDVDWTEIDVDMKGLEEDGKGEWEGVRRRYWTLDKYRLPVCTFLG